MNPIIKLADDPNALAFPEPDAQSLYAAKVHAHGTPEVIRLCDEWGGLARKMIVNSRQLKFAEDLQAKGHSAGVDVAAVYGDQAAKLAASTESADKLRERINQELCND